MAFWNRDDGDEWEEYRKSKENEETAKGKKPLISDEFKTYFRYVRQGLPVESGDAPQPGEKATPLQTFLSRFRGDKPEVEEGPPEKCPWCGGDMVRGYLTCDRGFVYWKSKKPGLLSRSLYTPSDHVTMSEDGDFGWKGYKIVWHCPACFKMVTDIQGLDAPLGTRKPTESGLPCNEQASAAEHGDGAETNKQET